MFCSKKYLFFFTYLRAVCVTRVNIIFFTVGLTYQKKKLSYPLDVNLDTIQV